MRLGIVMPVVLQNEEMLQLTRRAIQHLRSSHEMDLFVMCNRLHVRTPEVLQTELRRIFDHYLRVVHKPDFEGTVAGAWNLGFTLAIAKGCDVMVAVANDTELRPTCLDALAYRTLHSSAALCSGISMTGRSAVDISAVTDGPDFSCFAMKPSAFLKHGDFDTNYRPAYFEDNDYHARIVLAGGSAECCHAAQFDHLGSGTVKLDPDMAVHVRAWFEKNREYFKRKWGCDPVNSPAEMLAKYYRRPWGEDAHPLSWFPEPA